MTEFGFRMGPFAMVGSRRARCRLAHPQGAAASAAPIADALCEAGRLGQKTGSGYYRYEAGIAHAGTPDPEVERLIANIAASSGIARAADRHARRSSSGWSSR